MRPKLGRHNPSSLPPDSTYNLTQTMANLSQLPQTTSVLGLPLHLLNDYPAWLWNQFAQHQSVHIVTLNAEMAMQAEQDQALAIAIRKADLVIPDGAGVVFHLKLRGIKIRRCPGIELAETLIRQSVEQSQPCPIFFYGGKPGVTEAAAIAWQQKQPGLNIAGVAHGYLSAEEEQDLCQTLQTLQPRLIFIGLGVPRQEYWIIEHRHLCPDAIWVGVGGSFDIWAGTKTRAPGWMCRLNLEWAYRLYQEPWRWRRMLALPQFAWRSLTERRSK
jgi:N-acetylglucosaminyldiphosphoundecaprenol N-acetyl-beta-D-mannosaminyltransferase